MLLKPRSEDWQDAERVPNTGQGWTERCVGKVETDEMANIEQVGVNTVNDLLLLFSKIPLKIDHAHGSALQNPTEDLKYPSVVSLWLPGFRKHTMYYSSVWKPFNYSLCIKKAMTR